MKVYGGHTCVCRRCKSIILNGGVEYLVDRLCHEMIHVCLYGLFEDEFEAGIVNSCLDFLIFNMGDVEGELFRPLWYPDPGS